MKKIITWILLANGAQARVLEHSGPGTGVHPVEGMEFSIPALQAKEIMADRPGRSPTPTGGGRTGMEPKTDPVAYREAEFVKSLADMLATHLEQHHFDRLVIAAAPIALGVIRKALAPAVRDKIVAEMDKDLTKVPKGQLAKHFEDVLAV